MNKKIYDLSTANQAAEQRKILIADSGKEYDVSFTPAIVNRKYYKAWTEYQKEIMSRIKVFVSIQAKTRAGGLADEKDGKHVEEFLRIAKEAAQAGNDLIVYCIRANGYNDFDENEMFENFSEKSLALAINFIMGVETLDDMQKKNQK